MEAPSILIGELGEVELIEVFCIGPQRMKGFEWEIKCQLWPVLSGPTMTGKVNVCRKEVW